jgi:hypothetical protein
MIYTFADVTEGTGEQPGWRQLAEVRPSVRKDSNTVGVRQMVDCGGPWTEEGRGL